MKKFLSALCAFVLLLGAGITLSACGKKDKDNTIKFESGNYACIAQQDTLNASSELTEPEQNLILNQFVIDNFSSEGLQTYSSTLLDNTFVTLNKNSIDVYMFTIIENLMFSKSHANIKAYSFDNDTLTFEDGNGNKYVITKDEEGNLTCQFSCYYDFGFGDKIDNKLVFTITVKFEKLTETSTKVMPTEEAFYGEKIIAKEYELANITGLEDYFEGFKQDFEGLDDFEFTLDKFNQVINASTQAKIVLFEDNTLYYTAYIDMVNMLISIEPNMALYMNMAGIGAIETHYGFIYTVTQNDNGYTASISSEITNSSSFTYAFDANNNLVATINLNGYDVTYTFAEVVKEK